MVDKYSDLKRRRTAVGLVGCLVGLLVGAPVTYLLYSVWFNFTTFSFCCAGAALALLLGERAKKILKAEDLNYLRFRKRDKPLGLSASESPDREGGNLNIP